MIIDLGRLIHLLLSGEKLRVYFVKTSSPIGKKLEWLKGIIDKAKPMPDMIYPEIESLTISEVDFWKVHMFLRQITVERDVFGHNTLHIKDAYPHGRFKYCWYYKTDPDFADDLRALAEQDAQETLEANAIPDDFDKEGHISIGLSIPSEKEETHD